MTSPNTVPITQTVFLAQDEFPWRTDGLFSPHYLIHRLPNPNAEAWPEAAEAEVVFEFAKGLFAGRHQALQIASEEEAEQHWILPLLEKLGFGANARKAIPNAGAAGRSEVRRQVPHPRLDSGVLQCLCGGERGGVGEGVGREGVDEDGMSPADLRPGA